MTDGDTKFVAGAVFRVEFPQHGQRRLARTARPLDRSYVKRQRACRRLDADRNVARQTPQQPQEIEPAFPGEKALGACLVDQRVSGGGTRRRGVAELHVA